MKEVNSRQIKSPHTGNSPHPIQPSKVEPPQKELSVSMKVILCISALALVFIAFAVVNASIGIKEIEIEGEVLCTEEEILSIAGIETGKGYFSYNSSKAEEKVKELLPCVDRIHISRSFFGKVKIDLEEEKGYWYVESYGEYFALSKDLVIIKGDDSRNRFISCGLIRLDLPEIKSLVYDKPIEIFDEGRDVKYVSKLLDDIMETQLYTDGRIDQIEIKNKFSVYTVVDLRYRVHLGNCTDVDKKIFNLDNVLRSGKLGEEDGWEIDLSDLGSIVTRKNHGLDFSYLSPEHGG